MKTSWDFTPERIKAITQLRESLSAPIRQSAELCDKVESWRNQAETLTKQVNEFERSDKIFNTEAVQANEGLRRQAQLIQKRIEAASLEAQQLLDQIGKVLISNAPGVAEHLTAITNYYLIEATTVLARFHGSKSKDLAAQTEIVARYKLLASNPRTIIEWLKTHPQHAETWANELINHLDKMIAGEELIRLS